MRRKSALGSGLVLLPAMESGPLNLGSSMPEPSRFRSIDPGTLIGAALYGCAPALVVPRPIAGEHDSTARRKARPGAGQYLPMRE